MKIKELIKREKSILSLEFFPPKTKEDEDQLFETVAKLEFLNPNFVSVTYGAGGGTLKNTKRVGSKTYS